MLTQLPRELLSLKWVQKYHRCPSLFIDYHDKSIVSHKKSFISLSFSKTVISTIDSHCAEEPVFTDDISDSDRNHFFVSSIELQWQIADKLNDLLIKKNFEYTISPTDGRCVIASGRVRDERLWLYS